METLLICLIVSFLMVKGGAEDLVYAAKHQESPRQKARRERLAAGTLSPTDKIGHAVADRLANRIATGPGRSPMRRYFGDLWEDAWTSATEYRREKQAWKRNGRGTGSQPDPTAGPLGDPTADVPDGVGEADAPEPSTPADGHHRPGGGPGTSRRVRPPRWWRWNTPPARPQPSGDELHDDLPPDPTPTPTKEDTDVIDAEFEVIDDSTDNTTDQPEPDAGEAPALPEWQPLALEAAPITTPAGGESEHNMSAPAEGGLSGAIAWTDQMGASSDQAISSLETTASTLEAEGWGQEVTGPLREAMDHHSAIKGLLEQSQGALNQSLTVKDAYQAVNHTGSKESVLAE